jgi:tetratricopeptide (TPR) repeat protein
MKSKISFAKRFIIAMLILVMVVGSFASADTLPYVTYNFDYWEDIVYTPAAYVPDGSISAASLGLEDEMNSVTDLYVQPDFGLIYILDNDTTNNTSRVIVVNAEDYSLVTVIDEFYNTDTGMMDTFATAQGIFMTETGYLYVCDTNNERLLIFKMISDSEYEYYGHLESSMIESDILEEGYAFKPLKVCVDAADRIYVINQNEKQGVLQLEQDGTFNGYFGTISVSISLWQKFWKTVSTKAQRSKSSLYVATEYTGIDLDDDGFLYATYLDTTGSQAVMRLNSKGGDVIRKGANENVGGDIISGTSTLNLYCGTSRITDVVYCGEGIYSMIDKLRGRIFTYDSEGNLLYIYGGYSVSLEGCFSSPSAIETNGQQRLVSDVNRTEVTIFSPTQYGTLINEAVACRYDGDETEAVEKWNEVLKLNENFEQAYIGIGKAYLNDGQYKKAMDYLDLGMSRSYYSIAYKRYRNDIIKANFNWIFGGIIVIIVLLMARSLYKKSKKRKKDDF